MSDLIPSEPRIHQAALERILKRATELQSKDREIGDGLSEAELLQLGEEVGILPQHLRQALSEERSRELVASEGGLLSRFLGPGMIVARRTVPGRTERIEASLREWMSDGELMQVKRRFPDRTSWERKEGALVSVRRSLGGGGRKYVLAGAAEVVTQVTQVGPAESHVLLIADLSNKRAGRLIGSSLLVGSGASITGILLVLNVLAAAAVVPAVVSLPIAVRVARSHSREVEKFQVAMEQILDRLEHGELEVKPRLTGPTASGFTRIADEIRRNLGI